MDCRLFNKLVGVDETSFLSGGTRPLTHSAYIVENHDRHSPVPRFSGGLWSPHQGGEEAISLGTHSKR